MEIQEILDKYGYEKESGRIGFRTPAIKLVCQKLGIKWSELTRAGKASLRGDMIDQYTKINGVGSLEVNEDGQYYMRKGR